MRHTYRFWLLFMLVLGVACQSNRCGKTPAPAETPNPSTPAATPAVSPQVDQPAPSGDVQKDWEKLRIEGGGASASPGAAPKQPSPSPTPTIPFERRG